VFYRPRRAACAASSVRLVMPSFPNTLRRWVRTVPAVMSSRLPRPQLLVPEPVQGRQGGVGRL
jgi:hypothetical protein